MVSGNGGGATCPLLAVSVCFLSRWLQGSFLPSAGAYHTGEEKQISTYSVLCSSKNRVRLVLFPVSNKSPELRCPLSNNSLISQDAHGLQWGLSSSPLTGSTQIAIKKTRLQQPLVPEQPSPHIPTHSHRSPITYASLWELSPSQQGIKRCLILEETGWTVKIRIVSRIKRKT